MLCYFMLNNDHACINTLAGTSNVMTTSVTTMHFSLKLTIFKGDKSAFESSYDKQDLTLVVISYEMTTSVGSSICNKAVSK